METPESHGVVNAPSGVAAFVDTFSCGPVLEPVSVGSVEEFAETFGRAERFVPGALAVRHFFDNGGKQAWVCGTGHEPGLTTLEALVYAVDSLRDTAFDLLCVPAAATLDEPGDLETPQLASFTRHAVRFVEDRQAMFLLDPPHWIEDSATMTAWARACGLDSQDAAVWFPPLKVETDSGIRQLGASGAMAGVIARVDREFGIWKAPTGTRGQLHGVSGIERLSDAEMGELNQAGVNSIRTEPGGAILAWGARTIAGATGYTGEWRYLNVRRTAQYVTRSITGSGLWPEGMPNDAALCGRIRQDVDAFCLRLFLGGALQGATPGEAWFVRCDTSTITQGDVDDGVVNLLVGLALSRPGEFANLRIQLPEPTRDPASGRPASTF
ncbi:hypothetical protein SAMN02745244_03757 [Tessaracoccus bendigoensis DSM 12906]|uniref:Tail sheath protein subtilisin-like domain-containing protein n=1 Tax=Tessaracoccus bendigoensis DSM 12906 TaxID=1123357 RepID=A0A1M6P0R9_9ACTN|nr:phage tail sheath subtilisin-like domain-containing protein [Tessaracoccus bendigoensis]SHK01504.1 hypothetical protein SAMN02745244_03757 [Tessaracoccus bendigoensis DSM 12906]